MRRVSKSQIEERAKDRPPGYLQAVMSRATAIDGDIVMFEDDVYSELVRQYGGTPIPKRDKSPAAFWEHAVAQHGTSRLLRLASYPRSGNTLLRLILRQCFGLRSTADFRDNLNLSPNLREMVGQEHRSDRVVGDLLADQPIAPIKTHELANPHAVRTIYVVRDGRDACASYAAFFQMPLEQVITDRNWSRHVQAGVLDASLVLHFEKMTMNLAATVAELAEFLAVKPVGDRLPVFSDLNRQNPKVFRLGQIGAWKQVYDARLENLFWLKHASAMEKFGYSRDTDDLATELPPRPVAQRGIGSILKAIIADRWGAMPCGSCAAEISMLNHMTPEQARAEAPALAARMAKRWERLPRWWQRLGVRMAMSITPSIVVDRIESAIEEAIQIQAIRASSSPSVG